MNSRFYALGNPKSTGQLQSLSKHREQELQLKQNAVDEEGELLEYEALELRIHPPNVRIDNDNPHHTVLIIDSANRPGTLVEVVQCLTELGLSVRQARISSDGGWFVDEFHVSETPSGRVTDPKKLTAIKQVLALPEHPGEAIEQHTVFQIAGPDTPGLLAEVTQLLSHNGLEIRTAAAWTFHSRAAIVIGVTEQGGTVVRDRVKLARLQQLLTRLVEKTGSNVAVSVEQVEGPVHHERRLHQLLLADEVQAWKQLSRLQRQHSLPFPGPANLHAATADVEQEADQSVPSTPQQQWQRRMLPPTWSVDVSGRPVDKEDLRQGLQEQQQQQQTTFQQQQAQWLSQLQHGLPSGEDPEGPFSAVTGDDLAPETPAAAAAVSGTHTTGAGSSGDQQPAATPIAIDSAAACRAADAASVAAAAAQQASVDKLIALLQPQPLAHVMSLPPDKQQQQSMGHGEAGPTAGLAQLGGASSVSKQQQQAAVQQHPLPQQQPVRVPVSHHSAAGAVDSVAAAAAAGQLPVAAGRLPPKGPSQMHAAPVILLPAQLLGMQEVPKTPRGMSSGSPGSYGRQASSVSAPCSPSIGPRAGPGESHGSSSNNSNSGSAFSGAPGAVAAGSAGSGVIPSGVIPWSPRVMASASAAAGLLSPRALPLQAVQGGVSGDAAGAMGLMGLMGLQQQQQQQQGLELSVRQQSVPLSVPVATVLEAPEVQIQHSRLFNYWLVSIRCRDRNKLFFDTVCTLSDMRYDTYHATIDAEPNGMAQQLFYIRPRFGECVWDERKAAVLKAMLVSAVQRRFPPGLRLHVFSGSTLCLQDLVAAFKRHTLSITRCKVRAYDHASHTFYLLNQDGSLPSRQHVQQACQSAGGELVEVPLDVTNPCVSSVLRSLDARGRFPFSFINQRAQQRAWVAKRVQQVPPGSGARGVLPPGGPIDIGPAGGAFGGRDEAGVVRGRGVLGLLRGGDGVKEQQHQELQRPAPAPAAASYCSDQPSF